MQATTKLTPLRKLAFRGINYTRICLYLYLLAALLSLVILPHANSAPGDVDPLNANIQGNDIKTTAVQADGKMIVAGFFSSVMGEPRNYIVRLNRDGTLDTGFNPAVGGDVYSVAVQPDGKILLGGAFKSVAGSGRKSIARLTAAGTLDNSFDDPNLNNTVLSIALQADGKILVGGAFTSVAGSLRGNIARLTATGALDIDFNPNANGVVNSIVVQADGAILLGGSFTSVSSTNRNCIARLTTAGALDSGFNANVVGFSPNSNGVVSSVTVQADGQILLGGFFRTVAGITRNSIARVTATGALDVSFNPNPNGPINSIALQADGQILLGGSFTAMAGRTRNHIARVTATGALDLSFDPNANGPVFSMALQADGKILLGGGFNSVGISTRNFFARLLNGPATQTLTAVTSSQVLWSRGGSAPDVSQTTFELSTDDGVSFTPLVGTATRVGSSANWQLSGLSLPSSGQLRARGLTTVGGFQNGSSGLVEQVASWVVPTEQPIFANGFEEAL